MTQSISPVVVQHELLAFSSLLGQRHYLLSKIFAGLQTHFKYVKHGGHICLATVRTYSDHCLCVIL